MSRFFKRVGKTRYKFQFQVTVESLRLHPMHQDKEVTVSLVKGAKAVSTPKPKTAAGPWGDSLNVVATLYRDKHGRYQEKAYQLVVKQASSGKPLATFKVDASHYATASGSTEESELRSPKEDATAKVSILCTFLKESVGPGSDASSLRSDAIEEEDEDLEEQDLGDNFNTGTATGFRLKATSQAVLSPVKGGHDDEDEDDPRSERTDDGQAPRPSTHVGSPPHTPNILGRQSPADPRVGPLARTSAAGLVSRRMGDEQEQEQEEEEEDDGEGMGDLETMRRHMTRLEADKRAESMRLEAALAKLKAMEDELANGNLRSPSDNARLASDKSPGSLLGGVRLVGLAATQSPSKDARRAGARVEELERQLTGLMTASEEEARLSQRRLKALETELEASKGGDTRLSELQSQLDEQGARVRELEEQVEAERDKALSRLEELEAEVEGEKKRADRAQEQVEEEKARADRAAEEREEMVKQLQDLTHEADAHKREAAALRVSKSELEEHLGRASASQALQAAEIMKLGAQLVQVSASHAGLEAGRRAQEQDDEEELRSTIRALQQQMEEVSERAQQRVEEAEATVHTLEKELARLQEAVNQQHAQAGLAGGEAAAVMNELQARKGEAEGALIAAVEGQMDAERLLSEERDSNRLLSLEVEQLRRGLEEAHATLEAKEREREEESQDNEETQRRLQRACNDLRLAAEAREASEKAAKLLEEKVSRLEADLAKLETELQEKQAELAKAKVSRKPSQQEVSELEGSIDALAQQSHLRKRELESYRGLAKGVQQVASATETTVTKARERVRRLSSQANDNDNPGTGEEEEVEVLRVQLGRARDEIGTREKTERDSAQALQKLQLRLLHTEAELRTASEARDTAYEEIDALQAKLAQLERQLGSGVLGGVMMKLQSPVEKKPGKAPLSAQEELEMLREKVDVLEEELSINKSEWTALFDTQNMEKEQYQADLVAAKLQVAELSMEVDELKQMLRQQQR